MKGDASRPAARSEGLIVERLPGELLVYDEERDEAHCLHGEAAAVFDLLDGARTSAEISALASLSERRVEEVLSELSARHLLLQDDSGLSRRALIHAGAGVAGAALITSIAAPVPAAAQSPNGECALDPEDCVDGPCGDSESGICGCIRSDGVTRCVQEPGGPSCQTSSDCPTGWYCANDPCFQSETGGQYYLTCAPGCGVEPFRVGRARSSRSRAWFKRR